MAHTQSALKHVRQTRKHTFKNRAVKERIKDLVKKLGKFVAEKNSTEAKALLKKFYKLVDKAAKSRVLHKNRAARLKSAWGKKLAGLK